MILLAKTWSSWNAPALPVEIRNGPGTLEHSSAGFYPVKHKTEQAHS